MSTPPTPEPGSPALSHSTRGRKVVLALLGVLVVGVSAYLLSVHYRGRHHFDSARAALEQRDFQRADEHLQACLRLWPQEQKVHLLAARAARQQGRFEEAHEHLQRCQPKESSDSALRLERRLLWAQQGDAGELLELERLCRARPTDPETPLILEAVIEGGLRALKDGFMNGTIAEANAAAPQVERVRERIADWLRLCKSRPDEVQGLVWRGTMQVYANDLPAAREDFRRVLALDANHFEARLQLARLLLVETPGEALESLEQLRQQQPTNPVVLLSLATVRRSLGQHDAAQRLLDERLADHPKDIGFLLERGRLDLDAGRGPEAEQWFRRILTEARDLPEAVLGLAQALSLSGRDTEARVYHQRFLELRPPRK